MVDNGENNISVGRMGNATLLRKGRRGSSLVPWSATAEEEGSGKRQNWLCVTGE